MAAGDICFGMQYAITWSCAVSQQVSVARCLSKPCAYVQPMMMGGVTGSRLLDLRWHTRAVVWSESRQARTHLVHTKVLAEASICKAHRLCKFDERPCEVASMSDLDLTFIYVTRMHEQGSKLALTAAVASGLSQQRSQQLGLRCLAKQTLQTSASARVPPMPAMTLSAPSVHQKRATKHLPKTEYAEPRCLPCL